MSWTSDISQAFRVLRRRPGLTFTAVLTLALGIGATTAMFTVVNAVLLRPLPYGDSHELLRIYAEKPTEAVQFSALAGHDVLPMVEGVPALETVAAYNWGGVTIGDSIPPRNLGIVWGTKGFLDLFEVQPVFGRTFTDDDHEIGAESVLVASWSFFQNEMGGDESRVGELFDFADSKMRIVGVMPQGFAYPAPEAFLWRPRSYDLGRSRSDQRFLSVIARRAENATPQEWGAQLSAVAAAQEEAYPASHDDWGLRADSLRDRVLGDVDAPLWALFGTVFLVLLAACANVAHLLMARGMERRREIAVRAALGAGQGGLVRLVLIESSVLAALGGLVGLGLGALGVKALVALGPEELPRIEEVVLDPQAILFTIGLTALTALLFGLAPAWTLARTDLRSALHSENAAPKKAGRVKWDGRRLLTVAEVAVSLLLLVGAGLLLKSFLKLTTEDLGYDARGAVGLQLFVYGQKYPSGEERKVFVNRLLEEAQALPGVESAAITTSLPLNPIDLGNTAVRVVGRAENESRQAGVHVVSPEYFGTLRVPLRQGRIFGRQDHGDAPLVVVINETARKLYFRNGEAVGQRLSIGVSSSGLQVAEVVGVVADSRLEAIETPPAPDLFIPYEQYPTGSITLMAQTSGDPNDILVPLQVLVAEVDPTQSVYRAASMQELLRSATAAPRFYTLLSTLFAAVALILAAVGLYGVQAFSVARRTREIGVRRALGARRWDVVSLLVRQGMAWVVAGVVTGLVAAIFLAKLVSSLLYGTEPTDFQVYAGVTLVLLLVAGLACLLPARRAASIDPINALRQE
ncbi:MAG: ABC transporter permease [Acidobacteriota bacterium]